MMLCLELKKRERERVFVESLFSARVVHDLFDSKVLSAISVNLNPCHIASSKVIRWIVEALVFSGELTLSLK
jgi:hypothetical protein